MKRLFFSLHLVSIVSVEDMVVNITFSKLEGAQNDFILVDNREQLFPREEMAYFAASACHRKKGIGADGVIFIEPAAEKDFRMLFFNPDGSHGSMCGNGGRCAALFASARLAGSPSVTFDVLGESYTADVEGRLVRLHFPDPREVRRDQRVRIGEHEISCHFIDVGAPHVVVFLEDQERWGRDHTLDTVDVPVMGHEIRHHTFFEPAGVNVNFLTIDNESVIHLRTFEKGVEAETESCGTGTIATALVASLVKGLRPPIRLISRGGDTLVVAFTRKGNLIRDVSLEGPARHVYDGSVRYDVTRHRLQTDIAE